MCTRTLAVSLIVLSACAASAKVGAISLTKLTQSSQVIVVADVTEIVDRAGARVAVAKVVQGLKGASPNAIVEFVAEPTWACDVSDAKVGERVLLFLDVVSPQTGEARMGQGLGLALAESSVAGRVLYKLGNHGGGRVVINRSTEGDSISTERWSSRSVWKLNAHLLAPKGVQVVNSAPIKGAASAENAQVALEDIIAATKTALEVQQIDGSAQTVKPRKVF